MKTGIAILFAVLMFAGAIAHIINPDFYAPMIPEFVPEAFANITSTVIEAGIGVLLLFPNTRKWGGLAFLLLMLAFMPIHIWDLVREDPVMGSMLGAIIRLVLQLLLIYGGWWIWQKND